MSVLNVEQLSRPAAQVCNTPPMAETSPNHAFHDLVDKTMKNNPSLQKYQAIVDALDRSANKTYDDTFCGLIVVILVHGIAHVIHVTFAKIPTLTRHRTAPYRSQTLEIWGAYIVVDDSGTRKQLVCAVRTQRSAVSIFYYNRDDSTCSKFPARNSIVNELVEGEWDPAPTFPRQI
ncbi:hypothetical protein EDD22DRAFT_1051961 [Suillus occidentalis]|nr:hypothetical protein EDD22DRAFT_1051961 [Suillus occidentalis]